MHNKHLQENTDFAYEGHFTNEETWSVPRKFKEAGYNIHLIFLGLDNPELLMLRVVDRTKNEGGHYVSQVEVESNFYGNMEKLDKHFTIFDSVKIIDTSDLEHMPIATFNNGVLINSIARNLLPVWFVRYLPAMALQVF